VPLECVLFHIGCIHVLGLGSSYESWARERFKQFSGGLLMVLLILAAMALVGFRFLLRSSDVLVKRFGGVLVAVTVVILVVVHARSIPLW
jgi:hypothetical protein